MNNSAYQGRAIYIVDGSRTPFLKARGKPGPFSGSDLAVQVGRQLLERQPFAATEFDEVITGAAMPGPDEANISRIISLRLGCGKAVPAWTVMRNCASGMQALDNAAHNIAVGRSDLVLAGGTDAMSHSPLIYNNKAVAWFVRMSQAKSFGQKIATFAALRPGFMLTPIVTLLKGLTDPLVGLNMGQTAENLAYQFNITRTEMDEFAVNSHQKLAKAQDEKLLPEIATIYDYKGNSYDFDDGIRRDSTVEDLAKLKPFFDKKFGMVTAANSSQITDGAAFLILASEAAVKQHKLKVLGRIVDCEWAGLDPAVMGLGPVFASTPLMQRNHLKLDDIDFWEINEAFATQVIACLKAWDDEKFCIENLGLENKLGMIDTKKLNVHGDAIAMGHPIGASGARIVLQLLHTLRQHDKKRGIATLCIGGGQGGAMLIEACDAVV